MAPTATKERLWSAYWKSERLYCPLLGADPNLALTCESYWSEAAASLRPGARVLDLGCGNGFVALAVVREARRLNKPITIDAIDAAAIAPKRYVRAGSELFEVITFHPQTPMEALPFQPAHFDAVFSQYSVEHGEIAKVAREIGRVLKPGGSVRILSQSTESRLVRQIEAKAASARHVLEDKSLFTVAAAVAQALQPNGHKEGGRDPREYLSRFSAEVARVMQQHDENDNTVARIAVFTLQDILTRRSEMSLGEQILLIDQLKKGLSELAQRGDLIARSALGEATVAAFLREMKKCGLGNVTATRMADETGDQKAWKISNQVVQVETARAA